MADESFRIDGLDFLRGCAVMGILLANIVLFALPLPALYNPFGIGTSGPVDLAAWLFNFLFVDGKMRAIFAMLFGAGILLVMESAEMDGRDGFAAHRRRMLWLLPIGLAHYLLLWSGDILLLLALCGLVATLFVRFETLSLIKLALALILGQWLIDLSAVLPGFWLRAHAGSADATAHLMAHWRLYADQLGMGDSVAATSERAHYLGTYGGILQFRLARFPGDALDQLVYAMPEMLAFVALGMAMLKGGFLAGQWRAEQYRATWQRGLLVGLVPMAGLALWVLLSRDPLAVQAASFGWSLPLRLPFAVALAALAMEIAGRVPDAAIVRAVRSVGRLALSNYLLTSLVMTSLFYGYGAGLFGSLNRAALMLVALAMWAVMLAWSPLWRRSFGQGPVERLWRSLARSAR
ncbi:DUF418 domain-containing protein [Sphingobium nicotianae]|uniref:DUF418 domain-containing protein n=1 Tax=Sphingobium nicotianae TaxID=2782607 RepID=A0A9X1DEF1_9SPHN|nr:DUF418 domain-containing protein [Sphingobium nicotianae]MBT2188389.1 DUF418 domain-containing protein [Sphingobium nicotianae]